MLKTSVIDVHPNGIRHYPQAVDDWLHARHKEGYRRPEELVLYKFGQGLDFDDVWVKMEKQRDT